MGRSHYPIVSGDSLEDAAAKRQKLLSSSGREERDNRASPGGLCVDLRAGYMEKPEAAWNIPSLALISKLALKVSWQKLEGSESSQLPVLACSSRALGCQAVEVCRGQRLSQEC